ncbi:hypothetical protein ACFXA4_16435 [Streptomyces sp. NPDC059442]|uniref:hypothetical protein n=1 Tax=Streptomyces sp. NPDC059442 TaxID=3346830 RepID=UPI0036B8FC81
MHEVESREVTRLSNPLKTNEPQFGLDPLLELPERRCVGCCPVDDGQLGEVSISHAHAFDHAGAQGVGDLLPH